MDKLILFNQLQKLRHQLYETAARRGSLTDPEVLAISEEADRLILILQRIQRQERKE